MADKLLVPAERIEHAILVLRGQKVMLDSELAALYEVPVKALNRAVKRNIERFPADFMFQLTDDEVGLLRRHFGTSNAHGAESLRSQFGTSKGRGGRRYLPYAFTEQGVAMLSSVLRSQRAVHVNIEIMRAFVRLRQMLQQNTELARKLAALERKYDGQFKMVFEAIRDLMTPAPKEKPRLRLTAMSSSEPLRRSMGSSRSTTRRHRVLRTRSSLHARNSSCATWPRHSMSSCDFETQSEPPTTR